jgi:hypothetical protein
MSEESKDLFGKINALFEKRAPDALVDKGLAYEDFPVLTEVIRPPSSTPSPALAPCAWGEPERRVFGRRATDRRQVERRGEDRRQAAPPRDPLPQATPPQAMPNMDAAEHLVKSVERRLSDLFIRQQIRLEEVVRKAVREELAKKSAPSANPAEGDPRR